MAVCAELWGLSLSIDRPYNDFVAHAKFDHQSYGLTMNMENNAYLKYDVADTRARSTRLSI